MRSARALGAEDVESQIAFTARYHDYSKKAFPVPIVSWEHHLFRSRASGSAYPSVYSGHDVLYMTI